MFWPCRFTRYILNDILQLFLVVVIIMTSVIMSGLVVQRLMQEGASFNTLTLLLPYTSVISLQFALPTAILFATCTIYGRISADNEITAVKGLGVSPWKLIFPTLTLGLLMSPFAVWLNDMAVSWGLPGIQNVAMYSLEEIVFKSLKTNRSYVSDQGLTIHVMDVKDRWLISPEIVINGEQGAQPRRIIAEKARIRFNPERESLTVELVNWRSENGSNWKLDGGPATMSFELPLSFAANKKSSDKSASMISLHEIPQHRELLRREIDESMSSMLTRSSMMLVSGKMKMLCDSTSVTLRGLATDRENRLKRLNSEPYRRWAQGFSCFFFVWVGIPMAILRKSADYTATFAICFLPILLMYYPFFMMGVDKAKAGTWHPASPWLANLFLFVIGGLLFRKVYRS